MYFDPMLSKDQLMAAYLIFAIIPLFFVMIRFIGNVLLEKRRGKE